MKIKVLRAIEGWIFTWAQGPLIGSCLKGERLHNDMQFVLSYYGFLFFWGEVHS